MFFCLRLQLPIFLLTMMLCRMAPAQEAVVFDTSKLPQEGHSLADFTPHGWLVADRADGDLNADGISDKAAILVQQSSRAEQHENLVESQRVLLVLISGKKGKLLLGGSQPDLLQCLHCGGVKESVGIEIKKGILIVSQLTGSREFTDQTWRFRYDPKTRRFMLIGKDVTYGDGALGTGDKESFNFLTGLKIRESYRYDQKRDREITLSSKKEKIPQRTSFLEEVKMD
ncbi:MAG: hypothetical protein ACR65R_13800 [Methylomicrobium sp.]